jgi:hypothetical protein
MYKNDHLEINHNLLYLLKKKSVSFWNNSILANSIQRATLSTAWKEPEMANFISFS